MAPPSEQNVSPVDTLVTAQRSLIEQMTKFISNTKKTALVKRTHGFYLVRVNGWHDLWQKFLTNDEKLSQLKSPENTNNEYFTQDLFAIQEQLFYEFKGELVDTLDKLEKERSSTSSVQPNITEADTKAPLHTNLPRISLPKFSGDYNEWVSFKDLFLSVIDKNPNLEDVQKFHYLKTILVGEAANVIKQFSITNSNYASAWKALTQRYENKRVLVSSLLKTLTSQPKIYIESATSIKNVLDVTSECLASLENLKINTLHWDPLIIHIITQKLPADTHKAWEESVGDSTEVPSWADLKKCLELRFRTLEAISGAKLKVTPSPDKKCEFSNSKQKIHNFYMAKTSCILCNNSHSMRSCPKFLKLDARSRLQIAKSKSCCLNCLGKYHSINKCLSTARCSECNEKHHTLLHNAVRKQSTNPASNDNRSSKLATLTYGNKQDVDPSSSKLCTHFTAENRQVLLATAIVHIQTPNGVQCARALIDPGSQATFITNSALRRMNLRTISTMVRITGLGNSEAANSRRMTKLVIKSPIMNRNIEVNAITLDQLINLLPSKTILRGEWEHLQGLKLADPTFHTPDRIDVLIGADIYPLILLDGLKTGPLGTPAAQNTIFGWILSGQIDNFSKPKPKILSLINTLDLNFDLKRFWEVEEVSTSKVVSPEDEMCEQFYQTTHSRRTDGTYVVRLPFKNNITKDSLGSSRHIALKRFLSMERSAHQKNILINYNEVLNEYQTSKHMEEIISPEERVRTNYVPHHAVIKAASSTTKLRVVFDASCKTTSGKSLNDILLTGPALQQDITTILMRWRFHKYVFTADIEKMYRQIWIHPDDADYQRILWRSESTQPVKDYRLLTVTFGVCCAPYLAIRTLHQLANDEKHNFPDAARCLLDDFYVDDALTGCNTIDELNLLKNDLIQLLKKGGFHLRKFSANNANIVKDLPVEDISTESLLQFNENPTIKALGITWNPKEDVFRYKLNMDLNGDITKRNILSKIAKLFDPLGWLSPIVIRGKILMQKLWLAGLDWDSKVPYQLEKEWITFTNDLKSIEEIKLPRWINYLSSASVEFHGFCDSSESAYAAAIYVRIQQSDKNVYTHLVISKTKVAPVKSISLPRLELCGAHLLSKLVRNLKIHLEKDIKFHLWTDSTVVLAWLNSHPNRWKSFVANRATEIHNNVGESLWHHVPSEENPADLASRGILSSELIRQNLWWNGPTWLILNPTQWPQLPISYNSAASDNEVKKVKSYQVSVKEEEIAERFSSFTRACRVIAYCRRFVTKCKSSNNDIVPPYLTAQELQVAKIDLIRESQQSNYSEEIERLRKRGKISKKSTIISLNPFLDENEVLRVGGRLEHSMLTFAEKHPIILARSSRLTALLIDHAHRTTMHGGPNLILSKLRRNYWIPGVKITIRKYVHQCITCLRWRKETAIQIMGNLPSQRITLERPFYATGIDFAGPINIKLSKTRNSKTAKAYIAVFVCFATKALHIEVVSDLSSEAFLAALRRFFSRRGVCRDIYTDNGTNFVGTSKMIQREMEAVINHSTQVAAQHYANQSVNWHFIPPGAPHFGGLWEAGVKSIKHHLRRIIGQTLLTFEELTTMLTQIEAILNSRPLCPLSSNPDDFNPLTPGHFLIGDTLLSLPETDFSTSAISHLSRWQHLQKLKYDFWKRWSSEYLSRLQQRPKWKTEQPPVRLGDLVLLKEDNIPPSAWKLARISEIHPGQDNKIRVVTVKTPYTQLKRPITKICPLPFDKDTELTR